MNTTSWSNHQSGSDDGTLDPRRHRHRASTAPTVGFTTHPLVLMPGHVPQAIDRHNLYFTNATRMTTAHDVRNINIAPPPPVPLYPAHMATHFHPPPAELVPPLPPPPPRPPLRPSLSDSLPFKLPHGSLTSPPPIPPKPFSEPPLVSPPPLPRDHGSPNLNLYNLLESTPPVGPSLSSPTDESDIAMALAVSESVSKEEQKTRQYLVLQEEEELARALEVSFLETRGPQIPVDSSSSSSTNLPPFPRASLSSQSLPNVRPSAKNAYDDDDEALARSLAAEEETPNATKTSITKQYASFSSDAIDLPHYSPLDRYSADDGTTSTLMASMEKAGRLRPQPDNASASSFKDLLPAESSVHGSKFPVPVSNNVSGISDACDDEVFARLLAAEQEDLSASPMLNKISEGPDSDISASVVTITDLPQYSAMERRGPSRNDNCDDDEAFARMLAAQKWDRHPPSVTSEALQAQLPRPLKANTNLPQYSSREEFLNDRTSTPVASSSRRTIVNDEARNQPIFQQNKTFGQVCSISPSDSLSNTLFAPHNGRGLVTHSVNVTPSQSITYPNLTPPLYAIDANSSTSDLSDTSTSHSDRPSVVVRKASQPSPESTPAARSPPSSSSSSSSPNDHTPNAPAPRVDADSLTLPGSLARIPSTTSLSDRYDEDHVDPALLGRNSSAINLNAFVDKELFNGVSVGFQAPKISTHLTPMVDEMPLIISLPYGKSRPLHLQGPSWRHLLKLMAKLSGTRVEPALSAVAVMKTLSKLRTVIQFVKPHQTSTVWHTIFYFTIDYPSPEPNRIRSVNELPYSYSLAGVPTLLRDGADSLISKTYTIPASESMPYPTLPITFPELALYLQAALEESRRDSSTGNRKLAKMIKLCYPTEDSFQEPQERSSVGGLFKRVMGRTNRSNQGGGNEDTYELVTPFVQDEWG